MPELDRTRRAIEIRALWEGAAYGLLAGVVFLSTQVIVSLRGGGTPLDTFRWLASILMGAHAFTASWAAALVVGMGVHLALSAGWGVVFAVIAVLEPDAVRESWFAQLVLGALFGLAVWFVDFVVLAHVFYGWLLGLPPATELAIHVVFYGAPLGLLYGMSEESLAAIDTPE